MEEGVKSKEQNDAGYAIDSKTVNSPPSERNRAMFLWNALSGFPLECYLPTHQIGTVISIVQCNVEDLETIEQLEIFLPGRLREQCGHLALPISWGNEEEEKEEEDLCQGLQVDSFD
ncbi:hypothetical protein CAPTEDRAFT_198264 [Capitella teleta]|uniref:Uncharacterized protein n=1 Tax=Capitella teleta TaxID=283909 RepID=R7U7M3_CAPTE|nr:hypothetical protein CAPTEDRAFT_198264 [Capitella teleta]|eukprot:ELT99676.1 hypothetical protein CAPTEDRAFT_198264 [Capitella teleta]